MIGSFHEVVVDCADPVTLSAFWHGVLGGSRQVRHADWAVVTTDRVTVGFQRVPEAKVVKNRVHLDVEVTDMAGATTAAVALGATCIGGFVPEDDGGFQVLADPEGNEWCLVI